MAQLEQIRFVTDQYPEGVAAARSDRSENMIVDLRGLQAVPAPPITGFIPYANDAFIVCKTIGSAPDNAAALNAAYLQAKSLTPNGAAISAINRACVIVAPGQYDFGIGEFILDTPFVDIVGLSSVRESQYLTSQKTADGFGTIRQTADDIRISNLWATVTGSDTYLCAAYYPTAGFSSTRIVNARFGPTTVVFNGVGAMKLDATYSGYYQDVLCEGGGFGGLKVGESVPAAALFSGTAVNCTVTTEGGFANSGTCSGTLINCHSDLRYGYGGQGGIFSGVAFACTGGSASFGGSGGGSGTFSGKCYLCTAGSTSYGTGAGASITTAARLVGCTMTSSAFGAALPAGAIAVACIDSSGIFNFGSGGFTDPMTTIGDLIYRNASNVSARLPVGAEGASLKVVSGVPAYVAAVAGTHFEPLTDGVSELVFAGGDVIMVPGFPDS